MPSPYAGMTVNERLYAAGLLAEWDEAARNRDRTSMIEILGSVDLKEQAASIVDSILANPAFYGLKPRPGEVSSSGRIF